MSSVPLLAVPRNSLRRQISDGGSRSRVTQAISSTRYLPGGTSLMREESIRVRENAAEAIIPAPGTNYCIIFMSFAFNLSCILALWHFLHEGRKEPPTILRTYVQFNIAAAVFSLIVAVIQLSFENVVTIRPRTETEIDQGLGLTLTGGVRSTMDLPPRTAQEMRSPMRAEIVVSPLVILSTALAFALVILLFFFSVVVFFVLIEYPGLERTAPIIFMTSWVLFAVNLVFLVAPLLMACCISCCLGVFISLIGGLGSRPVQSTRRIANRDEHTTPTSPVSTEAPPTQGMVTESTNGLPHYVYRRDPPPSPRATPGSPTSEPKWGTMYRMDGTEDIIRTLSKNQAHCSVCCSTYKDGVGVSELPCGHHFHANCVHKWIRMTPTCPLCQEPINQTPTMAEP